MGFQEEPPYAVRYRGFVLLQQRNHGWLVRPERSPMTLLPFRTPTCSLEDVKSTGGLEASAGKPACCQRPEVAQAA